jgi:hypothetical protein
MKRDWDLLRNLLLNIEEDRGIFVGIDTPVASVEEQQKQDARLLGHLALLVDNGFVSDARVVKSTNGYRGFSANSPSLTMSGHDLLDTMRSQTIWESIKTTAKKKGIELSFEAVKVLSVVALKHLVG